MPSWHFHSPGLLCLDIANQMQWGRISQLSSLLADKKCLSKIKLNLKNDQKWSLVLGLVYNVKLQSLHSLVVTRWAVDYAWHTLSWLRLQRCAHFRTLWLYLRNKGAYLAKKFHSLPIQLWVWRSAFHGQQCHWCRASGWVHSHISL